ncbi:unnamed protein product, partial [Prorocentrum cordatum]
MLRFILSPQDKWAKDREAGIDFFQSLTAWEAIVAEYVDQSGEAVSDNVRASVLLERAPDPYREVLRQAPEEVGLTFGAARSHIRGYYNQGRTFTRVPDVGGVVPMQVGAFRAGLPSGKASGKGKTHKSDKSGGKSGKFQKGKDSKTKSRARDGGKHGKSQTEYFDGECGYCCKWGHKRADCRKKKADDAKKEPDHTRAVQGDAASSSGQQPADGTAKAASGYYDGTPDGWAFAVTAGTGGKVAKVGGSIQIDGGSDGRLRGVEMAMKEGIKATADFLVADVNDDLLSMGRLLRQGSRFNLSLEGGLYMTNGHRSVQLEPGRNSLRLPIVSGGPAAEAHHCRCAAERQDAATAPVLNADSSVGAMGARLRELFMPIYGTKAEHWDRLIVAEAAAKRSEAERARKQAVKEQLGIQRDPVEPRQLPVPKAPSAEEERQRRLAHLPAAPRREECIRGKAPDAPHAQVTLEDSERKAPLISHDFGFCKTADEDGGSTKVEDTCATMLVGFSSDAGVVKVLPCPSKSASPRAIAGIKSSAQRLETGKCRLRTDSEPATKAILDGAVAELTGEATPELTPKHSSQSNPAEAAVKIVEGQTRALRLDLEKRYGTRITAAMPIWAPPQAPGPAAAASPPQPQPQPQQPAPPAPRDAAIGAPPLQAARRGMPPEAEAAESKRARVAAVHELDVGNVDDPPDAFWEEISDEVEDPTEGTFDVGAQDELDKKLTLENLQSLLDHGVGEDIPKSEARGMKHIATRWENQWRWKPARQEWQRKVRFVCREFRWQEWRDDLFTPGSAPISNRLIDFVALKRGFEVMALDATDAFYQAPEHEDVVVDPPQEYLDRRTASPGWVEHMAGILTDEMRMTRCEVAPQFFYNSETEVVVELHMDDLHMAGPRGALEGFRDELGQRVTFSGGEIHEHGTTYEHLKRLRARFEHGTELEANPKYLDYVAGALGLGNSNTAPAPGVPGHKALMGGTSALSPVQAGIYRSCAGALMYMPRPTEGSNAELVGYGDSDRAGDLQTGRSQSSGNIEIDNAPMHSFSRRQGIAATSSGAAEYYAATAVAEDLLYFKSLLEFMCFAVAATLLTDSSAARGIAKREGVGKVRSLEARVLWPQQAIKRKLMDLGAVGTDDNKADLGTQILGHERFVEHRAINGIHTDMGQVAESDHQSEEVDFGAGAAARVRRARGVATSPSVNRPAALAMIAAAVALLQGCEGPAAEHDGYYDTEVCPKDDAVASDWTNYWLVVVVWTLVVATVFGYAGFRYDEKIDSGIGCMSTTSTKSMVEQSNQTRRTVGTQSQTTYKWRWAAPRFQPLSMSMHGAFLEVRAGSNGK